MVNQDLLFCARTSYFVSRGNHRRIKTSPIQMMLQSKRKKTPGCQTCHNGIASRPSSRTCVMLMWWNKMLHNDPSICYHDPPTQVGWSTSRCIDALELFSNNYLYAEVEADNIKRAWQQMTTMIIMEICLCLELYFHFNMSYQGYPEVYQIFSENKTGVLFGFQHHEKNTFNGSGGESKNGAILSE